MENVDNIIWVSDMRSIDEIELIGKKIMIAMAINPEPTDENGNVLVALNDRTKWKSQYGQIIKVGKDCDEFTQENVGDFVKMPVHMQADFDVLRKYVKEYATPVVVVDEKQCRDGLKSYYRGRTLIRKGNNVGWLTYTLTQD